jgi:hypothetical protein
MSSLLEKAIEKVTALLLKIRMRLRSRSWRRWPTKKLGKPASSKSAMSSAAWLRKPSMKTRPARPCH